MPVLVVVERYVSSIAVSNLFSKWARHDLSRRDYLGAGELF